MSERTIMPRPVTASDVVTSTCPTPDYARRFSLTVAEEALQKLGPEVIPWVVERLAKQIAAEQRGAVEATVNSFLRDRTWAEPVIRQAIRDAVRDVITDMLQNNGGK